MAAIETVKIEDKNKRGFKTINKSDYKRGTHKLYKAPKKDEKQDEKKEDK